MSKDDWWQSDVQVTPFYLLLRSGKEYVEIDVDEPQWASVYEGWMRKEGEWHLVRKGTNEIPISIHVSEGEQPYYVRRHLGRASGKGAGSETVIHGIGKKLLDGTTLRLWVMEDGRVCAGDDAEAFFYASLDEE